MTGIINARPMRPGDFAGTPSVLAETARMTKRALFAVAGFFGLCVSLSAQQGLIPEQFQSYGTLDGPWSRTPSVTLDQDRFFFSTAFGSMRTTQDFLPADSWQEPQSYSSKDLPSRRNSLDNAVDWRAPSRLQFGGEIGFLYGSSSGKYGGQDFSGYIIGTVGNDWFSITAGYLHQESNVRYPRWRR